MGVTAGLQSIIHADTDPMFILADPDRAFELTTQIKGLV
jgi:hypothetical protein